MNADDDLPQRLRSQAADQMWTHLWFTASDAANEIDRLRAWKAEAVAVLAAWEQVWEAAGRPGRLGSSKPEQTAAEVLRLRAAVMTQADTVRGLVTDKDELRALIAGCDAGQSASTCRVKLRLIADAMRAVCTELSDCVAIDHKPGCPMGEQL